MKCDYCLDIENIEDLQNCIFIIAEHILQDILYVACVGSNFRRRINAYIGTYARHIKHFNVLFCSIPFISLLFKTTTNYTQKTLVYSMYFDDVFYLLILFS